MSKRKIRLKSKHLLIIIGVFLILGSVLLLIYKYYGLYETKQLEEESLENFFQEIIQVNQETEEQVEEENKKEAIINYVAVLEIPKIDLKRGLVDKYSKYNDVDINIYTIEESTFPSEQANSHVILASHSGSDYYSFFNKLNQLSISDEVYLYYDSMKYIYEIINIYEVEKTGTINLIVTERSDITLITCISGTNKQVVYVGELIREESY